MKTPARMHSPQPGPARHRSGKHPALLADLATAISGEIAERLQYQADLVEVIGDGVAREAIRASSRAFSRSSCCARSAQRRCVSRSGQLWQG